MRAVWIVAIIKCFCLDPRRPVSPAARVAGLAVGVVLTSLPACSDADFATEDQVTQILDLPRSADQRDALEAEGRRLFLRNSCHNCHGTNLNGNLGIAPPLRGLYLAPAQLFDGTEIDRDPAYLARSILRPQAQIIAGYSQPMSSFRHLPAQDVAAIITYLHRFSPPPAGPADPP